MLDDLIRAYPWPAHPPDVPPDLGPAWFQDDEVRGHTAALKPLLGVDTRVVLELGSFLGRSTECFLRLCPNAHVIAVDTWRGSPEHFANPEWARFLPTLYETFQVNLWQHRARLTPLRTTTSEGLRIVHRHGVVPNLVYVDADHATESVLHDVQLSRELFPHARIVGDDWRWDTVRKGVEIAAARLGQGIATLGNVWWLTG